MKGSRNDINRNSNEFKHESSGGILDNFRQFAIACVGILPQVSAAWQVLHIHSWPS